MILQALTRYYDILVEDPDCDIARIGYSKTKAAYALNISKEGDLLEVLPLKYKVIKGKKEVDESRTVVVPEQVKKSSGIKSNFLCENSAYALGFDSKMNVVKNSGAEVEKARKRARQCHEAFVNLHREILKNVFCAEAEALLNFFDKWNPDYADEVTPILEYKDELTAGANIIFKLDSGRYLHECDEIKSGWEKHVGTFEGGVNMQCLVTGEYTNVARLNPSIKKVRNAQTAGASLVSFNAPAYESYGRTKGQGLNAPIGEKSAFAYGTVLNQLLSDKRNTIMLGDATVVFWAESSSSIYPDVFSILLDCDELENNDEGTKRDEHAISYVGGILDHLSKGEPISLSADGISPDTKFYILGLSPNAARISVRFFMEDSFGNFVERLLKHFADLKLQKQFENEKNNIPLWLLLKQTVSPKSKDQSASPLLAGTVMNAILNGRPYPIGLFTGVLMRIKAEQDISYYKVSIVKAYLSRIKNEEFQEVLKMALNVESENKAYLLGRLFAVLEKCQLDASPNIKATIKDRYFSSASATPAMVFPLLMRLSQHHISKAEYGYVNDKKMEEIMCKLDIANDPIPAHMGLEEQGIFVLGYYHQRNALYEKKSK